MPSTSAESRQMSTTTIESPGASQSRFEAIAELVDAQQFHPAFAARQLRSHLAGAERRGTELDKAEYANATACSGAGRAVSRNERRADLSAVDRGVHTRIAMCAADDR
jgi:hypothetical protein